MNYDALKNSYPSRRSVVYGRKGMVCTSQPLAAQAGLDMIKKGGNAVDAAIATAACMTVLEPTSNGIGSDAFALVWINNRLHGLNASGKAPMALNIETVKKAGHSTVPKRGWIPVMVPGAPSAWAELSRRFGRLSFDELLKPAITYAEEGYPVSPIISRLWNNAYHEFTQFSSEEYNPWFDTFTPDGHAPAPGEPWKSPDMAITLRSIASSGAKSIYQGELANAIDAFSRKPEAISGKQIWKTTGVNGWIRFIPATAVMMCGKCRPMETELLPLWPYIY